MIKKRFISMLVLLMTAVTGAWADDTYTVQFKANGNTKTVANVVLPHQFRCSYNYENGELDQIIKELYGLSAGYCLALINPCSNENVTCGVSGYDDYITISAPFEGTATVTGTYDLDDDDGNTLDYSLEISIPGYVAKVNVTGVTLSQTSADMTVGGDALTLTATVAPANATNKTVTWTTSDASVATVANGVVTAVGAGTATITATANDGSGVTGTCTVTVSPAGYSVALKEGTDDATNWQGKAGTGEYQELPLTGLEAGTAVSVKYIGTKKVKSVKAVKKASGTPLDNTTTAWSAGTFAVPAGGLTYSDAITVSGDVTLTLTDGETLTLNKGISLASGATLTIQGNGTMNVNGTSGSTASTVAGNGTIILTSGTLTAKGGNGGSVGGDHQMDVTANAGGVAINAAVTVNGGTLTATGGNGGSVTGDHLINCKGGAGGAAISGDLTVNSGTMTTTNGTNGSVADMNADCTAGAGGKAVAGTVTDNR